jgi:hypothetical protein
MNRRRAILVICIIACATASVLLFRRNEQPSYQGRPIGYWFKQLPVTFVSSNSVAKGATFTLWGQTYGSTGMVTTQAFAAFDHFGTNAMPYLMSKLQDEDSYAERSATRVVLKLGGKKVPFRFAKIERSQTVTALLRLGPTIDLLPMLSRLTNNGDSDIAGSARFILNKRQQGTRSTAP